MQSYQSHQSSLGAWPARLGSRTKLDQAGMDTGHGQGGFKLNFLFELVGRVWARPNLFEKELGVPGSTALDQFRPVWTSWDGLWTRHIGLLDCIKTSLTV